MSTKNRTTVAVLLFVSGAVFFIAPRTAHADKFLSSPQVNPWAVPTGQPSSVVISVQAGADQSLLSDRLYLYRVNAGGQVLSSLGRMYDDGTHSDPVAGDYRFTLLVTVNEALPGLVYFRASAAYQGVLRRYLSDIFSVEVTSSLIGSMGGTVAGPGGSSVYIPPNAVPGNTPVSIAPVAFDALQVPPPSDAGFEGAVDLSLGIDQLAHGAQISIPAPLGLEPGDQVLVCRPITVNNKTGYEFVAIASVTSHLTSSPLSPLPGITTSGQYVFLAPETPICFVKGTVTEGDVPHPGAVVTVLTSAFAGGFMCVTDMQGHYALPGLPPANPVMLEAEGSYGTGSGVFPPGMALGTFLDVLIKLLTTGSAGENLSFELGNFTGYTTTGSASVVSSLGPLTPSDGNRMALLVTPDVAGGSPAGASLTLSNHVVPSGATAVSLDVRFYSNEYPEWVGSPYDDRIVVSCTTPSGTASQTVFTLNSASFTSGTISALVPDQGVGNYNGGYTAWKTASFPITPGESISVSVSIVVANVSDNLVSSAAMVDNIRFGEVIEITQPSGDPRKASEANEYNLLAYDQNDVLRVYCKATAPAGSASKLRWRVQSIGGIKAKWAPHTGGDEGTGTGLSPTATFTGRPSKAADYGLKTVALLLEGDTTPIDSALFMAYNAEIADGVNHADSPAQFIDQGSTKTFFARISPSTAAGLAFTWTVEPSSTRVVLKDAATQTVSATGGTGADYSRCDHPERLVLKAALPGATGAQARHSVYVRRAVTVTAAKHPSCSATLAVVRSWWDDGEALLQTDSDADGSGDVVVPVDFSVNSLPDFTVATASAYNIIDNNVERDYVMSNEGMRFLVVEQILNAGAWGDQPGTKILMQVGGHSGYTQAWHASATIHEYGHNAGLAHRSGTADVLSAIMYSGVLSGTGASNRVTETEGNAILDE